MSQRGFRTLIILGVVMGLLFLFFVWYLFFMVGALVRTAEAAPLQPRVTCQVGVITQYDMAGRYESSHMMLEMHPCGSNLVSWINQYGEHQAVYYAGDRIPGGGVIAFGYAPDPEINAYLDGSTAIGIKPAEKGWIQLATITDDGQIRRIYRLQKTE